MSAWAYVFAVLCLLNGALGFLFAYRMLLAQRDARRLREQIREERIAASDEQARMIAVATAECGHEVAWKMLEAVAQPIRFELARRVLEDAP